jgi:hypothetical protein
MKNMTAASPSDATAGSWNGMLSPKALNSVTSTGGISRPSPANINFSP